MHVLIVGGVFGHRSADLEVTPEITLANGLRNLGVRVTTAGHYLKPTEGQFDLVHVHHLGKGVVPYLFSRLKTPVVFTRHASGREVSLARRIILNGIQQRAATVIALSESEQRELMLRGIDARCIPNGVDTSIFRPSGAMASTTTWRLLYVGQLIGLKRVDLLLQAVAALRAEGQDVLLTVLSQTMVVPQELLRLTDRLRLQPHIEWRHGVTQHEIARVMRESHLLCLPSMTESLPSVVTEAVLCGTPVIATDVGGIRTQVAEPEILIPPGDLGALTTCLSHVLARYERHWIRSQARVEQARTRFSVTSMVTSHFDLYKELC